MAITCDRVRGQKLFIRPLEPADSEPVGAFLGRWKPAAAVPRLGLVGKLVGELAAVLAMEITDDALEITDLVVAEPLRRKRVGRVMIDEATALAAKMEKDWLVAQPGRADGFLKRVGFVEGEGVLKRGVGR